MIDTIKLTIEMDNVAQLRSTLSFSFSRTFSPSFLSAFLDGYFVNLGMRRVHHREQEGHLRYNRKFLRF